MESPSDFDWKNSCLIITKIETQIMADAEQRYQLTQEQIDFFLDNGWLKLSNCFTKEQADDLQSNLWTRLGMDPNDASTWSVKSLVG